MKKTFKWNIAQKAELQWWENYLRGKDVAAYHAWKKGYWKKLLDTISQSCRIDDGMQILDAGCGPAGIFMNLQNCHVDAEDPLLDQYEKNLPHFKKELYPATTFYSVPLESFTTDKKYDIVFCMNAINHVSDIRGCYDLLVSFVKPGGKIVVTIDAHNFSFLKHLFRAVPGDILHPHQYDLKEYNGFLTSRNCTILQTENLKHQLIFDHYIQVAIKN